MKFKDFEFEFQNDGIISGVVVITPSFAEKLLASSKGNRNVNNKRVKMYANDMANGFWKLNGETIIVDAEGHLRNGHHRCLAIIESNVPQKCLMAFGVSDDSASVYDIARPRTYTDTARINEEDELLSYTPVQALVKFHFLIQKDINLISYEQYCNFANANIQLIRDTYYTACTRGATAFTRRAGITYAIFSALACGVHVAILRRFCEVVNSGIYGSQNETAAAKLREYCLTHGASSKAERYALLVIAENAIRDFERGIPRVKGYSQNAKRVYSNQKVMSVL